MQNEEIVLGSVIKQSGSYSTYFEDRFNTNGTPKDIDLERIFCAPQDHINDIVKYSKYCYRKYGIIMRVANIIRDFGCSDYKIIYPAKNREVEKIIKKYCNKINLESLLKDMLHELVLTGNLCAYDRGGSSVDIFPINSVKVLPLSINDKWIIGFDILNTFKYSDFWGNESKEIDTLLSTAYPEEIVEAKKQGKTVAILNPDNVYFTKVNSSKYERYGVPIFLPAFDDLAHKALLKEAEKSTAKNIIDKILCIKVGDADNKPSKTLIDEYAGLFDNLSGSVNVSVPYYVDISWIEPNTSVFGQDKFIQVDTDILNTLGVSLTLIRGEGSGSYSDGMISFAGLTKTINAIRSDIPNIIHSLFEKELIRNGRNPKEAPSLEFNEVVIDKQAKYDLVKELFTNCGLPYEVLYEECGFDYDRIKLIRENENKGNDEEIFKLRQQAYQGMFNNPVQDNNNQDEQNKDDNSNNMKEEKDKGAPEKKLNERKSDKNYSNNQNPRSPLSNK